MSLYTELANLDTNNKEHHELVINLAKAKAKHDFVRQTKHRKDPQVLETLLSYRKARNAVKSAAQTQLQITTDSLASPNQQEIDNVKQD